MTGEKLNTANRPIDYHAKVFAYLSTNVEFRKGKIEKLDEVELADEEFDLIVSNCVLNLSSDKEALLRHPFRVLKEGGKFDFSDVYAEGYRHILKRILFFTVSFLVMFCFGVISFCLLVKLDLKHQGCLKPVRLD